MAELEPADGDRDAPARREWSASPLGGLRVWWPPERRRLIAVGLAAVGLAIGAAWMRRSAPAALPPPAAPRAVHDSFASTSTTPPVIVHVAGAVLRPGVVTVPFGSRVIDAIDAAGGARADAEIDRLDLAARVVDGTRIYLPRRGETPSVNAAGGDSGGVSGAPGDAAAGPVNLNSATEVQLETLPGIGPSLAKAIIAERERRGGFRRVEDLGDVRGIGPRRLADLKPLVTV